MSIRKSLVVAAAIAVTLAACSQREETVVDETATMPPATDAMATPPAMSETAPTTVNPNDPTGAMGSAGGMAGSVGGDAMGTTTTTPPSAVDGSMTTTTPK